LEEGRTALTPAPVRLAYLVSQYPAISHTFILREIRGLRELGFDVHVASIRGPDRPFEQLTVEEQAEQRATFYIKPAGMAAALAANARMLLACPLDYAVGLAYAARLGIKHLLYFVEAAMFVDWMGRQRLSQVHMHFSTTVGLLARRIFPMKTSGTMHGSDEFLDPAGFHLARKVAAFDMVCAISEFGRSQLMRFSNPRDWHKLRVTRLGVDTNVFGPRPFRYNPAPFEILTVGRLAPVKGLHVLIGAVDRLIHENRNVRLRIAGDGPERARLESEAAQRGIAERVIFEGWRTAEQLRALYSAADVFALASFAEGIPVVLMEAMAMEIACVATRITGIPELIRHEIDGLLAPPANEEELAGALALLIDDSDLRLRLGKSGRQRVLGSYDLSRNVDVLADLLRKLAADSPARMLK
jgi:glycosyltransferase involved in cell wall biosynthesis